MLRSERVFGPDAYRPRSFLSGRVQPKTAGTNPSNLIFSLSAAFGPNVLGPKASGTQGYQLISQLEVKQRIKI